MATAAKKAKATREKKQAERNISVSKQIQAKNGGTKTSSSAPSAALTNLSIGLATGGGSARGNDFADSFGSTSGGANVKNTTVSTTPRSKSTLQNASFGSSSGPSSALKELSISLAKNNKTSLRASESATSVGRASNLNTAQNESITSKAGRSGRALTDREVDDLGARGYFEGDFVPGLGKLLPNGTFDTRGLDQLDTIKAKALEIQAKLNTMKANEATAAEGAVVSDAAAVKEEKDAMTSVAEANKKSPISQTLALLDQQILDINSQLKDDIKQLGKDFGQSKTNLEGQQTQETGQQSVQLANAGGYLGYSGSGQGVMLKLAESHRAELTALDVARQKAINDAKGAAAERKFDVVKEKANAIQRIEEAAYEAELAYQAKVKEQQDKQAEVIKKQATESDIFTAFQSGAKTPEAVYKALAGTVDIKTINDFLKNITDDIGGEGAFKFTSANNAALLGSGMAMDDIKAFNEYVNENGYDETVRGMLTAPQKLAADKIFREKEKSTGSGGGAYAYDFTNATIGNLKGLGYSTAEVEQIEYVLNNYGVEAVLYGEEDVDKRAALAKELGGGVALTTVESALNPPSVDEVITDIISTMSDDQVSKLKGMADSSNISSMWKGKKTDIKNLLNQPEMKEVLQAAINNGLTTEEILEQLVK